MGPTMNRAHDTTTGMHRKGWFPGAYWLSSTLHCCHTHTRNHGSATVLRTLDLLDPFATAGAGTAGTGAGAGAPGGGGAPPGRRGSDWHVSHHQGLLGGSSPGMSVRWA